MEYHAVVAHTLCPIESVGVTPEAAKLKPCRETVPPEVVMMLVGSV